MARVILDAGHGGNDTGVVFEDRLEKNDNLNLTFAVGNYLSENHVEVYYTRINDTFMSPVTRAEIANQEGADLLVTIHRGSGPAPNTSTGAIAFIYEDKGINTEAANNILENLSTIGFMNNDISFRNIYLLRNSNMPSLEIVVGYINNENDNALFDSRFDEIAKAIASGINEALKDYGMNHA